MSDGKTDMRHNILYFSSFGSMKGGGQRSLFYLVSGLDRSVFNPTVVCPEEGELVEKLNKIGVDTIVMPYKRFRNLSIGFIRKLLKLFREKDISLVHTDDPTQSFYAGIAALMYGIPLVWHVRVSNRNMLLDRLVPPLCARLILVADALKDRFYWLKATGKLKTIHNCINLEEFDSFPPADIRKELGIKNDIMLVGCIGRIEEMKGQINLARAVKIVSRETDKFKVLLVGEADPVYHKELKQLIEKLEIERFFTYTGYRKDTYSIIKGVDLMVLSSKFGEGLSRVVLEGMAASKPVITTDIGGNREAVIDGVTGYVVPPEDEKELAGALLKILEDRERRKSMGTTGRKRVESLFSIENNIRETEKLYYEVIRGRKRL
jgi:glycosyltransferase involved in cell wall biosynthesis